MYYKSDMFQYFFFFAQISISSEKYDEKYWKHEDG